MKGVTCEVPITALYRNARFRDVAVDLCGHSNWSPAYHRVSTADRGGGRWAFAGTRICYLVARASKTTRGAVANNGNCRGIYSRGVWSVTANARVFYRCYWFCRIDTAN